MTTNPEVLRLAREMARPFLRRKFSDFDEKNLQAGYLDRSSIVQTAIAAIEKTTELAGKFVRDDDGKHLHRTTAWMLERYDHLRQSEKGSADE